MRKALLIVALLAAVAVPAASASSSAQFGVQDDAWLLYGAGSLDQRVATLQHLGVHVVRLTVRWNEVEPREGALDWGQYGVALDALHAAGIPAVVTLWGAPPWANGGRAPNALPTHGFGLFAYAAARRFPWVHQWTAWNEPNTRISASPVSPALYVRRVLDPAYTYLHRASSANKVAGGVTSPRRTPSGMSPLAFMEGMHAAHAHLDAYAQNPYPGSPRETPFVDPCSECATFSLAHLSTIRADVTRLFGASKPIWLTEYGYQTNPPDRLLGVSPATQALYVGEAGLRVYRQAGVTMLINFMVRDDTAVGGWQSGFLTSGGTAKPSYRAFGLPLAEVSRSGTRTVLWGAVRPGSERRVYALQRWNGHAWVGVGGAMRTAATGAFERVVSAGAGQQFRITSPVAAYASPALRIR